MHTLEVGKKYREYFPSDDFNLLTLSIFLDIKNDVAFEAKEFVVLETDKILCNKPAILVQYVGEDTPSYLMADSPAYRNAVAIH